MERKPWTPETSREATWANGDFCAECVHRHTWREHYEYWGAKVSNELSECNALDDGDCPGVMIDANDWVESLDDLEAEELRRRNLNDDLILPWLVQLTGQDSTDCESIINAAIFLRKKGDF